jgi:hypothetical protein
VCAEQACFVGGGCLLQPCDSARRSRPAVLDALAAEASSDSAASDGASLVCSYLDVRSRRLHYGVFAPASGVRDCWAGLERRSPEAYEDTRVWEQVGFSERPGLLVVAHRAALLQA